MAAPGVSVTLSMVSTKNCASKSVGVESNGVPGIVYMCESMYQVDCDGSSCITNTYRVDHMLCGHGVRDQEPHKFDGVEASIANTIQDCRDIVSGRRNKTGRGRLRIIRTTSKERDLRRPVAVGNADGTGKLNANEKTFSLGVLHRLHSERLTNRRRRRCA